MWTVEENVALILRIDAARKQVTNILTDLNEGQLIVIARV